MLDIMTETSEKLTYSVEEVSERTSLSKAYVRNEIRAGNLKAKLIGRRVLIPASSLSDWLENGEDWKPVKEREAIAVAA